MATCSFCGKENPDTRKYCQTCGTRLSAAIRRACSKCGGVLQVDDAFCGKCGERQAGNGAPSLRGGPASDATLGTALPDARAATDAASNPAAIDRPEYNLPPSFEQFRTWDPVPPPGSPEELHRRMSGQRISSESAGNRDDKHAPRARLVPTHELLRMANALGIEIDYTTLRFWQKRGLVQKPLRGPIDNGRGTRGYYDATLIDRIAFIRTIQKNHAMGLDAIRGELEKIDRQSTGAHANHAVDLYQERLAELQAQREQESKNALLSMLCKSLGVAPNDIATVIVRKKDGQTIRLLSTRI